VVKIGKTTFTPSDLVENIVQGMSAIVEKIPKKWNNIQSLYIKTTNSVALPIFNSLPTGVSRIPQIPQVLQVENQGTNKDDAVEAHLSPKSTTPEEVPKPTTGKRKKPTDEIQKEEPLTIKKSKTNEPMKLKKAPITTAEVLLSDSTTPAPEGTPKSTTPKKVVSKKPAKATTPTPSSGK